MILVDTNILIDIASGDAIWAERSINALADAMLRGPLAINAIIYSEFSLGFSTEAACDAEITRFDLLFLDLPRTAGFRAGRAFRDYRRRGGARSSALPDFFIGAHASVLGAPILTRDLGRYRTYFPEVELVGP
ncbi:MAG: type II toxin-antitoxin system VapC family toxin [Methylocystis sp.]